MKTITSYIPLFLILSIAQCCMWQPRSAAAGDLSTSVPSAVEKGLHLLKTAGASVAFDAWCQGGLLAQDAAAKEQLKKFKEVIGPLKEYRSYEVIQVKEIGKSSKILYLSMSFVGGVLYTSFLIWKSDRDWLVQHLEFNTKPEIIMPWLLLNEGK